ncbi:MAG: serine/threonine-protein kinase [Acidobacteriota bacterium]
MAQEKSSPDEITHGIPPEMSGSAASAGPPDGGDGVLPDAEKVLPAGSRIGRFEILGFLGSGGMAMVYKVRDPDLGRVVALKLLRVDDRRMESRLMNEARAQARIEHANVCQVHEVGEADGRRFIAMQYVRGQTLGEAAQEMSWPEKATVVKQVAEALHAAHQLGLVHRDIKPSNIMVERVEGGSCRAYVMDFGLVRDLESPGLTTTGVVMGTPAYMSPEQAFGMGVGVDLRSDVYSLGATFYVLLTGRTLFTGSVPEILSEIPATDPLAPRSIDRRIPIDLDTIVMKCVEKDPSQRYQTAKALADDVGRYLDGEPIRARRTAIWHRLAKKAKRNRAVVGVSLAAMVLLLSLASIGLYAIWKARRLGELSQAYAQRAKEAELTMRTAYTQPLHDLRPERARVRDLMKQIKAQMQIDGQLATGPGHYALGRASSALHDYLSAHDHLRQAWDAGLREPELGYHMAISLMTLYQKAVERANQSQTPELKQRLLREAQSQYRDPAKQFAKSSAQVPGVAADYVEGLIGYYEARYDDALAAAGRAFRTHPWLVEAEKLTGDVYFSRGQEKANRGDRAGAVADYRAATASYLRCSETLRSDPELYDAEALVRDRILWEESQKTCEETEDFRRGLEACEKSVVADPESPVPHIRKSALLQKRGRGCATAGMDPDPFLAESVDEARVAVELDRENAEGLYTLGFTLMSRAVYGRSERGEILRLLQESTSCLERALGSSPGDPQYLGMLATALRIKASLGRVSTADTRAVLRRSIDVYRRAIAAERSVRSWLEGLAASLWHLARLDLEYGRDTRAELTEALATAQEASRLAPNATAPHVLAGGAAIDLARVEIATGGDPSETLAFATSELKRAAELDHSLRGLEELLVDVHVVQARNELEHHRDPQPFLNAGWAALGDSRSADSRSDYSRCSYRAALDLMAARWAAINANARADRFFASALKSSREELVFVEDDPEALVRMAEVCRWKAEWALAKGVSIERDIVEGLAATERLTRENRWPWRALALGGALELLRARAERGPPARLDCAKRAQDKLQRALENSTLLKREYGTLLDEAQRMLADASK